MEKPPEFAARGHRVPFVSSEVFSLAKTGGLADVSGALPAALSCLGADVRVMLPGYPQALDLVRYLDIVNGREIPEGRLLAGCMPDSDIPVILFDAPAFFRRKGSLYQDVALLGGMSPDKRLPERDGHPIAASVPCDALRMRENKYALRETRTGMAR